MLSNFTGSMADGLLTCEVVRLFKPPDSLSNEDKFKNFDIGKGNWILMLAKGIASPFSNTNLQSTETES